MSSEPVPANPGWDDDPAWSRPDPMTAEEFEASLDRLCELDEPKDARVERWAEDSGNAALMGCELPPDEVLAADQRITWWAHELRKVGLEGGMDQLRARAFLDLLLGQDSRPRPADPQAATPQSSPPGQDTPDSPAGPGGPPPAGPGGIPRDPDPT
jgi:hypothetical protein